LAALSMACWMASLSSVDAVAPGAHDHRARRRQAWSGKRRRMPGMAMAVAAPATCGIASIAAAPANEV
jgi:hypothetical protein